MKKLLLIGGGTIATHYKAGLDASKLYQLVAIVDTNPNCAASNVFDAPVFTDLTEALKTGAEVAMVSTSTNTHFDIAFELLRRGVAVIVEKPMCDTYEKVWELFNVANQTRAPLGCLFHWTYADEVMFLKSHLKEFGPIERINVRICDDYANTPDGAIRSDRKGLCGAWLDSGINVLSYIGQIVNLKKHMLLMDEHIADDVTGQLKFAHRVYRLGNTLADITVDWRTASREKTSQILCKRGVVEVNHSLQTVMLNGNVIYQNTLEDRLTGHYLNAFQHFVPNKAQLQRAFTLHQILFEGGWR